MTTIDPDMIRTILTEAHGMESLRLRLEAILPAPTMADIAWDDSEHAGLCAESTDDGVVRMIGLDWENDHADHIMCYLRPGAFDSLPMRSLTPIPGTRVDLTPRRAPGDGPKSDDPGAPGPSVIPSPEDVPDDEAWQVAYRGSRWIAVRYSGDRHHPWSMLRDGDWQYASDSEVTLIHRMVPEQAPDHPATLTTWDDYENAPIGTIVAEDGRGPRTKDNDERWYGGSQRCDDSEMAGTERHILRWEVEV